ncbi:MAG: caspase family protein, partial [Pirellulaceae bacterium]
MSSLRLLSICVATIAIALTWVPASPLHVSAQQPVVQNRNIKRGDPTEAAGGKSLAILVGVQNYVSVPKLKYCHNDVRLLENTLKEACRFDRVVTLTDDNPDPSIRPTLGNMVTHLSNWLQVANNGEYQRVLLYFSGHGFRDRNERLYFAPPDCNRQQLELTALPQSYLKQQLDACTQVPVKLLVLDCCHSGEGRGDGGVTSAEAALEFRTAKGLLTLASCAGDEVSLEWEDKQQGLFTYWLCQGLRGGEMGEADRDRDGVIDSYELHRYLLNHVGETAATMTRRQTVKLMPSEDWQGVAALARIATGASAPTSRLRSISATFTVREGDDIGPLVPGADVTLGYRAPGRTFSTTLGRATSDGSGVARLDVQLTLEQQSGGEYTVMVSRGSTSQSWRLPSFPESVRWNLFVPRPAPASPRAGDTLTNSIGMKLALIPAGEFRMGSPENEEERFSGEYQHRVRITKPFYLGVYEVTQGEYERVMGENPSWFSRGGG